MKTSKLLITSLLAAATMSATAFADTRTTQNVTTWNIKYVNGEKTYTEGQSVFKWVGSERGDAGTSTNWVSGTYSRTNGLSFTETYANPTRVNDVGFLLYFDGRDQTITVNGTSSSQPDSSDGGGVWVTGTGNVVTVSMGRWAGSIQVDAGNVLNTSWSQKFKDGQIVAYGTVNISGANLNFDIGPNGVMSDSRQWFVGSEGVINFTTNQTTAISNAGIVLSGEVDISAAEITGLVNRSMSILLREKQLVTFSAGLSSGLDRLSLGTISSIDGASATESTALTSVDSKEALTASTYYAEKTASGVKIYYLGNGYAQETLTWAGTSADHVWVNKGSNWTKDGTATSFLDNDNVVFGTDAESKTVSVASAVVADSVAVNDNYEFVFSNNGSVTASTISIDSGKTLTLSGTGTLAIASPEATLASGKIVLTKGMILDYGSSALANNVTRDLSAVEGSGKILYKTQTHATSGSDYGNNKVTLSDAFTGDFVIGETGAQWIMADGSNFGGSTIVLKGNSFFIAAGANVELSNNIRLDGNAEIWADSEAARQFTLNGDISGTGTFTKQGKGTVTLGGTANLTTVAVSRGTLNITGSATLGALTVSAGTDYAGTVNFNSTTATQLGSITATGGTTTFSGTGAFTVTGTGIIETKNGAVVNQTSGVAEAYRLVLHNSQANGADAYNLSGGVLNITSTSTSANNTAAVLVGHWGAASGGTASGALNLSGTGVLNVDNGSVSASHTSPGSISISGDSELNAYVLHLKSQGSSSQVTVSGNGRLNLGAGGFDNTTATNVLTFNGGTLGTFADAFSSSGAVSLGANGIIVDTEKRTLSTTGASSASGSAASITLNGVLSDATDATGSLTKRGAGTLTLGGANTYTGETVIEAGTLVAANANALGTGNVTVASGATLDARAGLQVGRAAIASTLTTNGSAKLVLGALNENTAAVAVTGDVMLSAGTIFDVGSLVADGKVVSFAGTLTVASGTLTKNNFLLNGAALGDRTHFEVSTTGNAVTISNLSHDVYTLTWYKYDESGSAVWSNGCTGWSYQASETSVPPLFNKTFQNGDNVIFSDDAPVVKNVVVDGAVSVGTMTIDSDANFAFSGQNGAAIGSSGALTKTGTGTATIDSTVDLYRIGGGIVVNGGKLVVDTASGYTGAVTAGENGTFTLNVSSDTTLLNTLSVAGTFEKTGAGTLILSRDNASLTGKLLISGGVVELASSSALGADSVSVEVAAGGTLDLKGKTKDRYYGNYVLSGGALINTGAEIGSGNRQLAGGITLKADSEIGGTENFGMVSGSFAKNTLTLNGHTLTKTGTNIFWLTATTVTAGTIDVQSGALKLANGGDDKLFSMESGSTIKLNGGTISAGSASVALGNVAIVLTDVNKGTARITADTNCSFNAGGATLYLDIGALTETVLTGEEVALTIAGSNVISAEGFFETVLVGTYDSGNNWINDTKWAYEAGSWNAAEGTLLLISVPEPSVFGLLAGAGALALAAARRRRKKA